MDWVPEGVHEPVVCVLYIVLSTISTIVALEFEKAVNDIPKNIYSCQAVFHNLGPANCFFLFSMRTGSFLCKSHAKNYRMILTGNGQIITVNLYEKQRNVLCVRLLVESQ